MINSTNLASGGHTEAALAMARKERRQRIFHSPWFWVAIGLVVLIILIVIGTMWVKRGSSSTVTPDAPIQDSDTDFDPSSELVQVDNSRDPEQILREIDQVCTSFTSAAQQIAVDWGISAEASKMWKLKVAAAFANNGAVSVAVLEAYGDDLARWDRDVQAANLKIMEAIIANAEISADITTCTQMTNFVGKEESTKTRVTQIDTKDAFYVIVPVHKETQITNTTQSHVIEYVPTCTKWQVDPAKLAAQMASKQTAYAAVYANLQNMVNQCPKIDEYIAFAQKGLTA